MIRRYEAPKQELAPEKKKTKPTGETKKPAETKLQKGPGENK